MDAPDTMLPGGNSSANWYDTWDRQASQSFSNTAKGLRNAPGENNCFLNSAVQVFWHIDVFRRSYRRLSGHLCMGHSCIFCALKVIFTQFQYSDQSSLHPSALRKALADTFAKQERFQLGHMDDAAECFENILNRIHRHIADNYNEDKCNAPHCIPHQKFAMTVFDQLVCPCGSQSEPHKFYEMVHYISANALVSQSRTMQENGDMLHPSRFGLLLRNAGAIGDVRDCPGNCGKRVQIRRTLLNSPDVVSIGLVWGSDKADPELAAEVTRTIGTTILFPDMFHSVMCNDSSQLPRLKLTSVVCYYGKHYSTFVFHTKLQEWVYFDDATVRQVGPDWNKVVERIARSRYQPLLLIYTNPAAQPVSTETAPSTRVMAPGYSMTQAKGSQEENKGKPNLPVKTQVKSGEKEALERSSSFEHRRQSSFMLAVTKQKTKEEAIYAVPHNNAKVLHNSSSQKDLCQSDSVRTMYNRHNSAQVFTDSVDGQENPDSYNYTLSNSDQYRRPGLNNLESNKIQLTQSFVRGNEAQRKDSFKKGKGKVPADVIRYHMDGTRRVSQSSDSDQNTPTEPPQGFSNSKPSLPMKPKHISTRSQSFEENMAAHTRDSNHSGSHKVIKPQATNAPMYDNKDSVTRAHTPVQSGLATLPRNKKSSSSSLNAENMNQAKPSSSTLGHSQLRPGSQPYDHHALSAGQHQYNPQYFQDGGPPPPYTPTKQQLGYQNCLTYQNVVENDMHSRQSSNSSILSSGTVIDCSEENPEARHNRQQSTVSQDTLTDKPKESKEKTKRKNKEEKRKEEKPKKDERKSKSKKEKGTKGTDKPPPVPDKKSPRDKDEGFSEDKGYIDRRMVESVLSFQKLQRSGSCVSQASNSSMESDGFPRGLGMTPKDNVSSDIPFDSASLDSHKDSGYGSSDRNSSSSTGSITMNPYEQYFLARSMIPPKTINHQAMAENMRKLMDEGPGMLGLEYTTEKDLKGLVTNPNEYYRQNATVGHVSQVHPPPSTGPPSLGLQKGMSGIHPVHHGQQTQPQQHKDLMTLPKAERDQHLYDALSGRGKGLPGSQPAVDAVMTNAAPPQPTAIRTNETGVSQAGNQPDYAGRQLESHGQHQEGEPEGGEQFIALCGAAEEHMDACVLAETSEQYSSALTSCQHAIDLLNQAMKLRNIGQTSFTYAQKKSNACVIKLRSLQKRLNVQRQESNTSTASSEAGSNPDYRSRQHKPPTNLQVPNVSSGGVRPPTRTASQNSMDSLGSNRSSTPVFDRVVRPSTDERVPPVEPHMPPGEFHGSPYKDRSFETNIPDTNSASNADLYGTLPRRKTQKSQDHNRQCNNQKLEAEVYQDFLENQRRQSDTSCHSRTSSGARTPVNELNPDLNIVNGQQNVRYDTGNSSQQYPSQQPVQNMQQNYPAMPGRTMYDPGYGAMTHSRMSQGLKPIPVTPPKIEKQNQHTESQPDLRQLAADREESGQQRPLTPNVLCSEETEEKPQFSVRDLKSRFESTSINDSQNEQNSDNRGRVIGNTNSNCGRSSSVSSRVPLQRQRSKSESESLVLEAQKPKSVLSKKNKTGSDRLNKPRKSVTFSTNVCLVEAADEWGIVGNHVTQTGLPHGGNGYRTNSGQSVTGPRHDDTDSSTSDSPTEVVGERACILCHKQGVEPGQNYCSKCTYYMSKFAPS